LRARHGTTFTPTATGAAKTGAGDDFLKGILDKQESAE
jgi:hypothetical protein